MKISVIIPNWNGKEKLAQNLAKILKLKEVSEFIVSDDASTDESVDFIKKNFPDVKVIENKINKGFPSNVNIGVKASIGDLIFLLNTDAIPNEDCLEFVIPHFKDSKIFSVSCNTGGNWSWAKFEDGFFWHYQIEKSDNLQTHQTLWASGGSGIFRKRVWDELGGLDQLYNPFYEEDVDIGYRATKRGYINLWEPRAKVEHHKDLSLTLPFANAERKEKGVIEENFSKEYIAKIAQRNQLRFIWKNITDKKLIAEHKKALVKMLLTQPKYWPVFFSALIKLPQVLTKRKIEKLERKLTDEEIFSKFASI